MAEEEQRMELYIFPEIPTSEYQEWKGAPTRLGFLQNQSQI